jgi:hypothetical protein
MTIIRITSRTVKALEPPTEVRPRREEPGTLGQQLEAIELFLANPFRAIDRSAAWDVARRLVIPHARARA